MIATVLAALLVGSTLVLAIAAIVIRLMGNSSAATRFSIWQIAVMSLLLILPGILLLPEIPLGLVSQSPADASVSLTLAPVAESRPRLLDTGTRATGIARPQADPSPAVEAGLAIVSQPSTGLPDAASQNSAPGFQVSWHFVSLMAFAVWLATALILLFRVLIAHFRTASAARSADCKIETGAFDWFPESVELAYCDRQVVPLTMGIWRRRVVLPVAAKKWSTDQLRMVLKHELAHAGRRDVLWQLVTSVVTSLFWFQPLARWADRQLKLERERACDDQVIAGGEPPADYATVLLQLAATMSGRKLIPAGALSMAQKPIEQRLATILSPTTNRNSTSRWFGTVATAVALLVVASVCSLRPFAPLASAATESVDSNFQDPDSGDLVFPNLLTGLIVDQDDNPVVDAELHLTATPRPKSTAYHCDYNKATIHLPVVKTDSQGKYAIDLGQLENGQDIWSIRGKLIAKSRPDAPFYKTVRKGNKPALTIRKIAFQPGKTISGRIVPPASSGDLKLKNPTVQVRPIGIRPVDKWQGGSVPCDSDGHFSVMVASDVRVSVEATADNFAGVGLEVAPQVRDLKEIQLKAGKTLKGRLLDRDGRPVAGVLVHSDTDRDTYNFGADQYRPHFVRSCKTDSKGEFELPPQHGKVRVSLRSSVYDPESNMVTASDRKPPVVIPLQIDLAQFDLAKPFILREAMTVRASGTVRWPDGLPVVGVQAKVNLMVGFSGIEIFSTKTDNNGNYTVLIPENTRSSILVMGASDSSDEWLFAKASPTSDKATQQSTQILGLAPLTEDVTGLDWKLAKRVASSVRPANSAEQELKRLLAASRSSGQHQIWIRMQAENNVQKKRELTELYQRRQQQHHANLIAFEEKHRGDFAGAVALASYIDLTDPEQLEEFSADYLDSPNADAVLSDIYYQGNLAHTRKILNTFAENSPHETVQATALYHEAGVIAEALIEQEYFKDPKWHPVWPKPKNKEEEIRVAKYRQLLTELMSFDSEQLLADFDSILETLKTKYGDHGSTVVEWAGERLKERDKDIDQTYADQLQGFRYQLRNLKSGRPLPHLVGYDVHGVDFDSERLRGKAVLLFFTSNLYTDRENFQQLRELKKRYAGRPFEIVSVMVDKDPEEAQAAVDDGKITWPTLYDAGRKLMHKWQFDPCSDRLLIDHQGVIRRRARYGTEADETIEQLVANAELGQN